MGSDAVHPLPAFVIVVAATEPLPSFFVAVCCCYGSSA
jgi:hypothetical protein